MDDLNKLITKIDKESPGFKEKVKKRSQEIQIAYQLRLTRESLNLTQKDVAEKWNIPSQVISRIENAKEDRISLHALNEYAQILGYNVRMELLKTVPSI
ncbi:MAG: helix-turn-helix domain-containing protein [Candidatus Desantisbacteria bacterium]